MRAGSIVAVAVIVIWLSGISALTKPVTGYASTKESPLRLTIALGDRRYCRETGETDVLHLDLQLTFANLSTSRIILFRGSNVVVRTLVSRSFEDASVGKHEFDGSPTIITSARASSFGQGKTPGEAFIMLPPGGVFHANTSVSLELSRTIESPVFAIRPGRHVLQIVVSTWPEGQENATEVARRWVGSGALWYRPITSEGAVLQVGEHDTVEQCSKHASLLAAGRVDPNAIDSTTGITALMAAIELEDIDLFHSLLTRGANVNAVAPGGMSALFVAAGTEGAYLNDLVKLGAECNVRSLSGQTPLAIAIRAGRIENVKLLIAAGVPLDLPNEDAKTPLRLAKDLLSSGLFDREVAAQIVQLLQRAGARE